MARTSGFRSATTGRRPRIATALLVAVLALTGSLVGSSVARAQVDEGGFERLRFEFDDVLTAGETTWAEFAFWSDGGVTDVVVALEVPAGWTLAPAPPRGSDPDGSPELPGRTCGVEQSGTLLRCTYDSVPRGYTYLVAFLTPPADRSETGVLEGRIEAATPDPGTLPLVVSEEVRSLSTEAVDIVADSATHRPEVPRSGTESVVSWTFRNNTPDRVARDLVASVDLPPGVEARSLHVWVIGTGYGNRCQRLALPRVSCRITGDVAAETIRVELEVVYETGGSYPFTATLGQASADHAPGNESLAHTVEVETGIADLQLTATASAAEVTVGDTYSYVVAVRSDGPHPVRSPTITDELPANVELLSARLGWLGWPCPVSDNAFSCNAFEVAPDRSAFVVVEARAIAAGPVASAPTVSSVFEDPDPASNTAPVTLEVVEPGEESATDLAVTSTPPSGPIVAGEPFTTVVEIENTSGRSATGVTLRLDGDPTNLAVVSATQGWFSLDCGTDGEVVCTIPTISAGGSTFVQVTTRAPAAGPIAATLTVDSDGADADPANNTVTVTGEAVARS